MSDPKAIFSELIHDAAGELFAEYGAPAQQVADGVVDGAAGTFAGIIGFTSPQLRGALCLRIPTPLAAATHPQKTPAPSIGEVQDWVGELCNQLLGRAKNRLLRYGVSLGMGTPVTASSDQDLRIASQDGSPWVALKTEFGTFCVMLDLRVAEGFQLEEVPMDEQETAQQEGEFMFF